MAFGLYDGNGKAPPLPLFDDVTRTWCAGDTTWISRETTVSDAEVQRRWKELCALGWAVNQRRL